MGEPASKARRCGTPPLPSCIGREGHWRQRSYWMAQLQLIRASKNRTAARSASSARQGVIASLALFRTGSSTHRSKHPTHWDYSHASKPPPEKSRGKQGAVNEANTCPNERQPSSACRASNGMLTTQGCGVQSSPRGSDVELQNPSQGNRLKAHIDI
jgi:hypothetical protein